jgi:hypothetical protein
MNKFLDVVIAENELTVVLKKTSLSLMKRNITTMTATNKKGVFPARLKCEIRVNMKLTNQIKK